MNKLLGLIVSITVLGLVSPLTVKAEPQRETFTVNPGVHHHFTRGNSRSHYDYYADYPQYRQYRRSGYNRNYDYDCNYDQREYRHGYQDRRRENNYPYYYQRYPQNYRYYPR